MTLNELISNVYTITNRPDRVAETLQAVLSATLKMHQSDYYYKDLYETGIQMDSAQYIQQIPYRDVIPLWRAFKYLRKYNATTNTPGWLFKLVEPMNVFDDYATQKQDVCYVAGTNIQVNSSTQDQFYLHGCYVNPNVTQSGYSSWIATDHPWAIIFEAAAQVFKMIGKDEEAALYRQSVISEQIAMLKESNITAAGY